MDYKNTLSVSQLTAQIKNLIESNYTSVIVRVKYQILPITPLAICISRLKILTLNYEV